MNTLLMPILILLIISVSGCQGNMMRAVLQGSQESSSSYVNQLRRANYAPGFEPERRYIDNICDRVDAAILNGDPVEDYWDKVILLPLEPFIQFNDNWMNFLDRKAQEYSTVTIPKCEKMIRDGFTQVGIEPREEVYSFIRAEFIQTCMDNLNYEGVRSRVFTELHKTMSAFFEPIMKRAQSESQKNQEHFSRALNECQRFWQYHSLLHKYAMQEKGKLRLRVELDEKYTPVIQNRQKKWEDSISAEQKEQYALQQVGVEDTSAKEYAVTKFLKMLTPVQYARLERQLYLWELLRREGQIFDNRLRKLNELARWLDENTPRAQASLSNEMQRRQIKAARTQAAGMMLFGLSSMMNAYTNWQKSYYNTYTIVGGQRHFQLYDQFGRYYYGTIR